MENGNDVRWFAVQATSGRGLGPVVFMVRGDTTLQRVQDQILGRGFRHVHSLNEISHTPTLSEWQEFTSHDRVIRPEEVRHG